MNNIKYFFQFIFVILMFLIFKILGIKLGSLLGGKLFQIIGPIFRSKKLIFENIKRALPNISKNELISIYDSMWENYGRVFAEYVFMKKFRNDQLTENISIEGKEILQDIITKNQKVIFISGHFSNFELMAMQIEKIGVKVAAIYRPLNNLYLNSIMEKIRKKYICKHQIKKGVGGLKELIKLNKEGFSTALMIDQRVSQGIKSNFFNQKAYTTTIPAQFVRKFNCKVVPLHIEREGTNNFKITISKPFKFNKGDSLEKITEELNIWLEDVIKNSRSNWIWSHNRWK